MSNLTKFDWGCFIIFSAIVFFFSPGISIGFLFGIITIQLFTKLNKKEKERNE